MARVLCINPWIVDFTAYNLWIEPLGLLTVAGVLRQAGHDLALIDCLDRYHPRAPAPRSPRDRYGLGHLNKTLLPKPSVLAHVPRRWGRYGWPVEVFEAELDAQPRPDVVLVTCTMTYWYPGAFEVIRRVKVQWPEVPVALGGVYATLCPTHAVVHSGADAVLSGAGEGQILGWLDQVLGKAHSCMHKGGKRSATHMLPAHDLRRPQGYVAVQTARGCPFHCPYCAVHRLAPPRFTPRPLEDLIAEIRWCVENLQARDVVFYDDALLFDAETHLQPLLDWAIAHNLHARFHTPNGLHARFVTRPLAQKMRQAGFVTLRLGLESADREQQHLDGAKVDKDAFAGAVDAFFAAGFSPQQVAAYVLCGRPDQSIEAVRRAVAFAHRLGVPVNLAQFSPVPGTDEWNKAVHARCIAPDADPLLHNEAIYPCADPAAIHALKVEVRAANRELLAQSR